MTENDPSNYSSEALLLQKWIRTWVEVGERILNLPDWMQIILLDDINTAVVNRITVMELIKNAKNNS